MSMDDNLLTQLNEFRSVIKAIARQWSTGQPADEDDLFQEMSLELWRLLKHRPDAPREYINTALRRVPLKYRARGSSVDRPSPKRRTHQWQIESLELLSELYGDGGNYHHQESHASPVEDKVIANIIQADFFRSLSKRQAKYLRLRMLGYSPKDIHDEFGLSWAQVKGLGVKIRAKARILLNGDGPACATLTEVAHELRLPLRVVNRYCHQGKLYGAHFERGRWLIPRPIRLMR